MSAPRALLAFALSASAALGQGAPAASGFVNPRAIGATGLLDAELTERAASDPAAELAGRGARRGEWLLWTVAAVPATGDLCCFGGNFRQRSCSLAREGQGWGTTSSGRPAGSTELVVLLEVVRGEANRLVIAGPRCPIDGDGRSVTALVGVDPAKSLDLMERLARGESGDPVGERALAALAYHSGDDAARRLERLATDRKEGTELRKNALFWAGQTRPELGLRLSDRILTDETGEALREQALFVLSQIESDAARARLRTAAASDRDSETRSKALFWLSQNATPDAAQWIYDAIVAERDREVREQGVFALSQTHDGVPLLVRLLRESRHADVKQQALFWLGQSDDDRALDELERLLED